MAGNGHEDVCQFTTCPRHTYKPAGPGVDNGDSVFSWTSVSSGLNGSRIVSLAIEPTNPATLYAVMLRFVFWDFSGNFVYKSVDGGQHWVEKNKGLPGNWLFGGFGTKFVVVDPSKNQTLYSVGHNSIYVSNDGAENWTKFSTAGLVPDITIEILQINPAEPNILYIGTSRGVFSFVR